MDYPEIDKCLSLMESQIPANEACSVLFNYKPIVIPGLVYRTLITGGFVQLMKANDQYGTRQFSNMIKYYKTQRQEAIDYLKQEAERVNSKRLKIPANELRRWMKNGCIDFDTYLIIRNSVMKKRHKKRMALRKEMEEARRMLSHVASATAGLIEKVDVKDFLASAPASEPPAPKDTVEGPEMDVVGWKPEDSETLPRYKEVLYGLMLGLVGAKLFCYLILRAIPPKP